MHRQATGSARRTLAYVRRQVFCLDAIVFSRMRTGESSRDATQVSREQRRLLRGRINMSKQTFETAGNLAVPFVPVVPTGPNVELVCEMSTSQVLCKGSIGTQQRLILAGGKVDAGCSCRIRGLDQRERISGPSCFTTPGTEDSPDSPPLSPSSDVEAAMRNLNRRAECSNKRK